MIVYFVFSKTNITKKLTTVTAIFDNNYEPQSLFAKVESSRTKFKVFGLGLEGRVLGLGLEDCKSSKMPVLGSRTALFFDLLKMGQGHDQFCFVLKNARELTKKFLKTFVFLENARIFQKICKFYMRKDLFLFFGDHFFVRSLVLGLGLEHSCPWPREGVFSQDLFLALAVDFVSVIGLGLKPCVLDSTCDYLITNFIFTVFPLVHRN